jgi:hypothetical protein
MTASAPSPLPIRLELRFVLATGATYGSFQRHDARELAEKDVPEAAGAPVEIVYECAPEHRAPAMRAAVDLARWVLVHRGPSRVLVGLAEYAGATLELRREPLAREV